MLYKRVFLLLIISLIVFTGCSSVNSKDIDNPISEFPENEEQNVMDQNNNLLNPENDLSDTDPNPNTETDSKTSEEDNGQQNSPENTKPEDEGDKKESPDQSNEYQNNDLNKPVDEPQKPIEKDPGPEPKVVYPTSVSLNFSSKTLNVDDTLDLTVTILPQNASDKSVTWASSNSNVAIVQGGKVKAKAKGNVKITVTTVNGKTAVCNITVEQKHGYSRPFNIGYIKDDLIKYGTGIGMKHVTHMSAEYGGDLITPENSGWTNPIETWSYSNTEKMINKMKLDLYDTIQYWKAQGATAFTVWIEEDRNYKSHFPGREPPDYLGNEYFIYILIG